MTGHNGIRCTQWLKNIQEILDGRTFCSRKKENFYWKNWNLSTKYSQSRQSKSLKSMVDESMDAFVVLSLFCCFLFQNEGRGNEFGDGDRQNDGPAYTFRSNGADTRISGGLICCETILDLAVPETVRSPVNCGFNFGLRLPLLLLFKFKESKGSRFIHTVTGSIFRHPSPPPSFFCLALGFFVVPSISLRPLKVSLGDVFLPLVGSLLTKNLVRLSFIGKSFRWIRRGLCQLDLSPNKSSWQRTSILIFFRSITRNLARQKNQKDLDWELRTDTSLLEELTCKYSKKKGISLFWKKCSSARVFSYWTKYLILFSNSWNFVKSDWIFVKALKWTYIEGWEGREVSNQFVVLRRDGGAMQSIA